MWAPALLAVTSIACASGDIYDAIESGDLETVKAQLNAHPQLVFQARCKNGRTIANKWPNNYRICLTFAAGM
jgi:hypothetical protein